MQKIRPTEPMLKMSEPRPMTHYHDVGVQAVAESSDFKDMLKSLKQTFSLPTSSVGRPVYDFGLFANLLDWGQGPALAISTDGIGTKSIIASLLGKYDTVGIDCVAMNVNDVICVGAEPVAMTDYIAVDAPSDNLFADLGIGLLRGARQARISIPGGEISQVPDLIKRQSSGCGFDLVGTCVGMVERNKAIVGKNIEPDDTIIGLASSGVHSNGLSLARHAAFDKANLEPNQYVAELGWTIGEELLQPTKIYVSAVMKMIEEKLPIKALVHVTSDGFMNLARVQSEAGFVIDRLPDRQPIFDLIQEWAQVPRWEMFKVFNMGVGFCVVVSPKAADRVIEIAKEEEHDAWRIGYCTRDEEKKVTIEPADLVGKDGKFSPL